MTVTGDDVFKRISRVQRKLEDASRDLVELRAMLASLDLPGRPAVVLLACPVCRIETRSELQLVLHRRNVHGEELPVPGDDEAGTESLDSSAASNGEEG